VHRALKHKAGLWPSLPAPPCSSCQACRAALSHSMRVPGYAESPALPTPLLTGTVGLHASRICLHCPALQDTDCAMITAARGVWGARRGGAPRRNAQRRRRRRRRRAALRRRRAALQQRRRRRRCLRPGVPRAQQTHVARHVAKDAGHPACSGIASLQIPRRSATRSLTRLC